MCNHGAILAYMKSWKGQYEANSLAGVLVALAMVPGAIAFALIAGVSPMIGMMSTGLMMVIMSIFGHRRLMVSAPSSGVSLVAIMVTTRDDIYVLAWATLVMGIIQISLSFLKLNKVIAYIPQPIVIGFMNALGFLLLTSQLPHIFGKNLQTYLFAVMSFMIIYTVPKWTRKVPATLVSIVILTAISMLLKPNIVRVEDLAKIKFILPEFAPFHLSIIPQHFLDILLFGVMLAVVATIQTSLTAQMMDDLTGNPSDKRKESMAQGIANATLGLLGGLGGSALVGQSKFNYKMGATSRLSTLVTGVTILLFLVFLGDIVGQIPIVVLATVLVTISFSTFDRQTKQLIIRKRYMDLSLMAFTWILIILTKNLALGVLIGTLLFYIIRYIRK